MQTDVIPLHHATLPSFAYLLETPTTIFTNNISPVSKDVSHLLMRLLWDVTVELVVLGDFPSIEDIKNLKSYCSDLAFISEARENQKYKDKKPTHG